MDRGIALSRQYGVDRLLQPIFDYIPTADSPPLAPKHITALPSRPRKSAASATLKDEDLSAQHQPSAGSKRAAAAAASKAAKKAAAAAAVAASHHNHQATASSGGGGAMSHTEMDDSDDDESLMMGAHPGRSGPTGAGAHSDDARSLSPTPSDQSESSATPSPLGSEVDAEYHQQHHHPQPLYDAAGNIVPVNGLATTTTTSRKRKYSEVAPASAHAQLGLGPLRYARMILDYFVSESTQVPNFLVNPPTDFDPNVVIDDDGHTALHWACAMGRIRIVKLLLTAGADIFRANSMGQTALMRSVMFTNNFDLRKFPELFELLHRSTINIDRNDRTVFHYIVDIALQKGKTQAARYYIENVLQRLVEYPNEVADILNFQDEEGETALTLAARARSKRLVKILLDHGADPKVKNRDGKSAEDYILEDERFRESEMQAQAVPNGVLLTNGVHHAAYGTSSLGGGTSLAGANLTAGGGGSSILNPSIIASYGATTHTSQAGQRASQTCIPAVAEMLESLATSFDSELAETERDIQQALTLVGNIEAEVAEGERFIADLQRQASALAGLEEQESKLVKELEVRMGKRFRLGWEKWVRDEDGREQAYEQQGAPRGLEPDLDAIRDLTQHPPTDAPQRCVGLREDIALTVERRKELFARFAKLRGEAGTGVKMGQYRQLIALGCSVSMDQVDAVIESLCETFDLREEYA
ncbi:hypothetical protein T439DRAFT_330483 [Meredithblackwellia eburnea MCA 4105]